LNRFTLSSALEEDRRVESVVTVAIQTCSRILLDLVLALIKVLNNRMSNSEWYNTMHDLCVNILDDVKEQNIDLW
jgi:hypothetical protein